MQPAYGVSRRALGRHHVAARTPVHVDVDEPRSQPVPCDVDLLTPLRGYAVTQGRDPPTVDRDPAVGATGRPVVAGEQACSVEHQVVCHATQSFLLLRTWRKSAFLSWGIIRCWSEKPSAAIAR